MDSERRPVARYLQNQAETERDHVEIAESGSTELRSARFFLNVSNRVRNSRLAVAGLLAGLGALVAVDLAFDDEIPDPIEDVMDVTQIVVSGALIGSAVRPVSRTVDMGLSLHDEFQLSHSFGPFANNRVETEEISSEDSEKLLLVRHELASYGRDLAKNADPKRGIGEQSASPQLDAVRDAIAEDISHEKDLPILSAGTVEMYVERQRVSADRRLDPRLKNLDELRENLTTEEDRTLGKKRLHSDVLDGIVMLFMEAQVLAEKQKQNLGVIQKKAYVIAGDFTAGIGSMYGLVTAASMAAGDEYKGLAYFADDAVSLVGIGLAPAFKRLFSTQTARDIVNYSSMKLEEGKERVFKKFQKR